MTIWRETSLFTVWRKKTGLYLCTKSGERWTEDVREAWATNARSRAVSKVRVDLGYNIDDFEIREVIPVLRTEHDT